jgi:predicted ATPase
MHLLRVQVPNFRVLKNVDITFEKEFIPRIFPLGSQNGGGKSTLLQLIFVLLHCSVDSERKSYLRNMLQGFRISQNSDSRVLANIEIFHNDKNLSLNFFSYKDSYIQELLKFKIDVSNNDFSFSTATKLEENSKKIYNLEQEIRDIEKSINRLESIKKIENFEERERILKREIMNLLPRSNLKLLNSSLGNSVEELQEQFQSILEVSKLNLAEAYKVKKQLEDILQPITSYLESQNLVYICNYSQDSNKDEDEVLLCQVSNIDITEANTFLRELSQRIFLAAPMTQVFLFISQESRTVLFREQREQNDYYPLINLAKSKIPGFFTYDFLAVDLLIESFKSARDRDFIAALETGEYGNSYKELLQDLNLILVNKKINLNKDFSGVSFKLENGIETVELYPEDLSHGELKRLSIYMWMKHNNIENCIVLMDEIELALHPDWQYKIVSDLEQWASSNQYILATHSYELCQALTPAHVKELEPKLLKESAQKAI